MAETAAHLVEHVLPQQPIRQWVLSFAYPLRFLFATRPAVLSEVLGIVYRAISTFLVRRAGLRVHAGACTGAVTLIQRFGSALNLNPHLHMLFLDGAYALDGEAPRFRRVAAPTQAELQRLLHTIATRTTRAVEKQGLPSRDDDSPALDIEPADDVEQLLGAAVHYRIATGPHAGRKALTLRTVGPSPPPDHPSIAQLSGFSLHAGTVCEARDRDALERLCRYIARPAVSNERLSVNDRGQVVYRLKHSFRDGTTHVVLDPIDFIARLAALVPRPRAHLTRYHGVFAPNCKHRHRIVPNPTRHSARKPPASRRAPMGWMQRLERVFHIDIEHCGVCGGTLRVIACIETPLEVPLATRARSLIEKSLTHLAARETGSINPPPRTAAPSPASPTPGLPISGPVVSASAGAPQPRCASPPVPFGLRRLPDMRSCLSARNRVTSTAIRAIRRLSHRRRTPQRPHRYSRNHRNRRFVLPILWG